MSGAYDSLQAMLRPDLLCVHVYVIVLGLAKQIILQTRIHICIKRDISNNKQTNKQIKTRHKPR